MIPPVLLPGDVFQRVRLPNAAGVEGKYVRIASVSGDLAQLEWVNNSASDITEGTLAAARLPATAVQTTGSYADPAWITALAASKITGTFMKSQQHFQTAYLDATSQVFAGAATFNGLLQINGAAGGASTYLQLLNNSSAIGILGSDASISGGNAADVGLSVYGDNEFCLWTNSTRMIRVNDSGSTFYNAATFNGVLYADSVGTNIRLKADGGSLDGALVADGAGNLFLGDFNSLTRGWRINADGTMATLGTGALTVTGLLNVGNANNRLFQDSGNLYVESDGHIIFRDTSSSVSLMLLANDGRLLLKTNVWHSDSDGNPRIVYNGSGGATNFYGGYDFVSSDRGHGLKSDGTIVWGGSQGANNRGTLSWDAIDKAVITVPEKLDISAGGAARYIASSHEFNAVTTTFNGPVVFEANPQFKVDTWINSSEPNNRLFFGSGAATYIIGYGSTPIIARNGAGTNIFGAHSTGDFSIGTASAGNAYTRLLVYKNLNERNAVTVRNDDTGSSATSELILQTYANSWGIRAGSAANNSNALEIREDALGANTLRFKMDIGGAATFNGAVSATGFGVGAAADASLPFRSLASSNATVGMLLNNTSSGSSASSAVIVESDAGQAGFRQYSLAHSVWPGTTVISSPSGGSGLVLITSGASNPIEFHTDNTLRVSIGDSGATFNGNISAASGIAVSGKIQISTNGSGFGSTLSNGSSQFYNSSTLGLTIAGAGSTSDVLVTNKSGSDVFSIPTGTTNVDFAGAVSALSLTVSGTAKLGDFTAATLPSASAYTGYECNATDSSVTTFGSTVAGGGSSNVKVRSNGTNWTVTGI